MIPEVGFTLMERRVGLLILWALAGPKMGLSIAILMDM
jgi:hypothetical protein